MQDKTTTVVKEILGRLGIEVVESYDEVSAAVNRELSRRGLTARVAGIRWGCVTVVSGRRELPQVDWLKDVLEDVARRSSAGRITSVRVRCEADSPLPRQGHETRPAGDERNQP